MNTLRVRGVTGAEPSARLRLQWTMEHRATPLHSQHHRLSGQKTDGDGGEQRPSTVPSGTPYLKQITKAV